MDRKFYTFLYNKKEVHSKGTIYTMLRFIIGDISLTVDLQQYLREKTVKKLNRKRRRGKRLHFRSKLVIARQMLKAVKPLIPKGRAFAKSRI